ncbi:Response regulator receiver domain containing protein [Tritrichomonas foetus]|uniref:Phosphodiesterase n=1 Tax=Tritrichomonas foetus TaxID=1144522 RepID=A0A1J4JYP2_9EUKA|nr:Response regulator receiver domain containing protein [Tritrichomonas foetus]|eukprot:OHT02389.1 Response regulator receiver domain containing protein [Tritrichomonas foetus]
MTTNAENSAGPNLAQPEALPPSQLASLPFTRDDIHILAIDDDAMLLKSVTKALTDLGYKVTTANNGAVALDILKSGAQVDFILSDVMMPVMNGPQFLTAARSDPRFVEIPIVMMSSNDQYEIVFDCLSKGADDYMIKPLSPQVLKNIYANVWLKRKQNAVAAKIQHQIVESSVITQKIEKMKANFSASVQTPVKDAATTLQNILQSGGIKPDAMAAVQNIIQRLVQLNDEEITVGPKAQIPTKMQDFFATQFGVSSGKKVVTPIPVTAVKKRAAPAVDIPHLQPLNLGDQLFRLEFNSWNISENMLMNLANDIFSAMSVGQTLSAKPGEVEHFLKRAMQGHKHNPFHNFRRACDSLQFVAMVLNKTKRPFLPFEKLGAIFAALLHDVEHPGTNNMFQIKTSSQLALTYNDRRVLENNSASQGSRMVQDCFSFSINDEQFSLLRQTFLNCVLRTDISKCPKFIGKVLAHEMNWDNKEHRQNALALLTLMGDLAYAVRPWDVAGYWYGMMRDEQLQQGDMERRLGMPVPDLMDRRKQRPQVEVYRTHFKVIVMPVFQAGARIFPDLEEMFMTALQRNLQIIEEMANVEGQQ